MKQILRIFFLLTLFVPPLFAQDPEPEVSTETRPIEKQVRRTFQFNQDGVFFSNDFNGARANEVEKDSTGRFVITIKPENVPINPSPWYAFKVWSKKKKNIQIRLVYPEGTRHRYDPKTSLDGANWTSLDPSLVAEEGRGPGEGTLESRPLSITFSVRTTKKPLWISGQELEDSDRVFDWLEKVKKKGDFSIEEIGQSREGRPIKLLKIGNLGSKRMMLVISRQHPPEVTGYFAMQAFVETLIGDSELAQSFRRDWGIYVVPLMNPDGVDAGQWRHNQGGVDLNRDWSEFNQPETRAVRDFLSRRETETGGKFYFGIDFHSTWNDVYYPMSRVYEGNAPRLIPHWLANIKAAIPNYEPRIQPSAKLLPTRVSRNHFFDKHGMEAIVFEIGDNTPRDFIRKKGEIGAIELMKLLNERK